MEMQLEMQRQQFEQQRALQRERFRYEQELAAQQRRPSRDQAFNAKVQTCTPSGYRTYTWDSGGQTWYQVFVADSAGPVRSISGSHAPALAACLAAR